MLHTMRCRNLLVFLPSENNGKCSSDPRRNGMKREGDTSSHFPRDSASWKYQEILRGEVSRVKEYLMTFNPTWVNFISNDN